MIPFPAAPTMNYGLPMANTAYGPVPYWGAHYGTTAFVSPTQTVPAIVVPEPAAQKLSTQPDVAQFSDTRKPPVLSHGETSANEVTRGLGMTALLAASKLLIGYVGVGYLNRFLFGVPAHFAGGLEAIFALIETGITSGLVYNKIPGSNAIVSGIGRLFGHKHDKPLEAMTTKEREACIAPVSSVLTGICTSTVTLLSFMKGNRVPGKSWLSAFSKLTPKSLLALGAGVAGSLAIGYFEGWVSKKAGDIALPKQA